MKNLLILLLFACAIGWSQDRPIRADVVFLDTLTTTERDALTMRPSQFALIANSTVDSVQAWIVDKWVNLGSTGSGETYTFGYGLTNTSGTITVTNPFEEADETKLDELPDGSNVVTLTGNQTITGVKTFDATGVFATSQFRVDGSVDGYASMSAGNFQVTSTADTSTWTIGNREGTDISNRIGIRPKGNWDNGVIEFDYGTDDRWEIGGSPIITAANASSLGVGGGSGDVTGPASATDNAVARFDTTTGKLLQNSIITIDDSGIITDGGSPGGFNLENGTITGQLVTNILEYNSAYSIPTDTQPASIEGTYYWDDSENRMKGYDGTSYKQFLMEGDSAGTDDQTASEVSITDSGDNFTATDVEGALAELAGSSGTDSGQTMVEVAATGKTLTLSDIVEGGSLTGRKIVRRAATDITDTIPSGLGQTGRMLTFYYKLVGADTVWFKKGSGAVIRIGTDAYSAGGVTEDGVYVTRNAILELNSDGSVDVFSDNPVVAYTETVPCTPTTGNVFPTGNAASECTGEVDSTSGWTAVNSTISSVEGDTQEGTSAIQIQAIGQNYSEGDYVITGLTDAAVYDVTYWYKVTLDDPSISSGVRTWGGVVTSPNILFTEDGEWHERTETITMSGTTLTMEFFANRVATTGTQTILIDHIRVVPQ